MGDSPSPEPPEGEAVRPVVRALGARMDATLLPAGQNSPSTDGPASHPPEDAAGFGVHLEPVLRETVGPALGPVRWFRTSWQRGGALTGYAAFRNGDGRDHPVCIKMPITPKERFWLEQLQQDPGLAPQIHAHGEALGGYDLAWVVMEKIEHGPLGQTWAGKEFDLTVEALARFYHVAHQVPVNTPPPTRPYEKIFELARANLHEHDLAHEQRWKNVLKKVHRKLREWLKVWDGRPTDQWCHGDVHLANCLTREPAPGGPAVLIDFAEVHAGHWVEDAVYFEHLWWARRHRLEGRRLCSQIAHERKKRGLPVEPDWPRLASIKRALLAMSTPAMLQHDGDPHHVQAALEVLEIEAR